MDRSQLTNLYTEKHFFTHLLIKYISMIFFTFYLFIHCCYFGFGNLLKVSSILGSFSTSDLHPSTPCFDLTIANSAAVMFIHACFGRMIYFHFSRFLVSYQLLGFKHSDKRKHKERKGFFALHFLVTVHWCLKPGQVLKKELELDIETIEELHTVSFTNPCLAFFVCLFVF